MAFDCEVTKQQTSFYITVSDYLAMPYSYIIQGSSEGAGNLTNYIFEMQLAK